MFRPALRSSKTTTASSRRRFFWGSARLWLQSLEERTTPANLVVTSNLDDGSAGTLRAVLATADTNGEADTVSFQAGVTAITLATGQIGLTTDVNNLTINGAGVTVNGAAAASATNRIFDFNVAGGNPTFTINGLTLANGSLSAGSGGAIQLSNDPLVLDGVTLMSNKVTGTGGAIGLGAAVTGAKLTIMNSTATGNSATSTGGVMNFPTATSCTITIDNSTFDSNTGTTGAVVQGAGTVTLNVTLGKFTNNTGSGSGGAITISNAGSSMSVNQSTFTNNKSNAGGGITFTASAGLLVENSTFNGNASTGGNSGGAIRYTVAIGAGGYNVRNCTFVNNSSGFNGGALGFSVMTAQATIQNCTFTGNTVSGTGNGGAIGVNGTAGTGKISLESCIVSGNQIAGSGTSPDIFFSTTAGGMVSVNTSVIGSTVGISNFVPDGTTSLLLGQNPMLGALANNGGPTETMLLSPGSPAINAGSNPAGLMFDQRGTGFARTVNGTTDIGAVEVISVIPSAKATAPNVPPILGTVTVTVVYSDETGINSGGIDVNDVTLSGPGYPAPVSPTSATPSGSGMMVTATYVFPTPVGGWDWPLNGNYTVNMQANQVFDTDGPNAVLAGPIGTFKVGVPLPPLVVDNIGDTVDGDFSAGKFTLREALGLANGLSGTTDSISFAGSLSGMTIALGSQLSITDPVIITGLGAAKLTLDGTGAVNTRAFNIDPTLTGSAVMISGLTIQNFNVTGDGGAINNQDAALTLTNMVLKDNTASLDGGAVNLELAGATLAVVNSVMSGNTATTSNGGAINSTPATGTVTISNSSFRANGAIGTGGDGGAIFSGGGTMTIDNSTLSGNTANNTGASFGGGAVYFNSTGTVTVTNCTIANNHTNAEGGAFHLDDIGATLNLRNSTVVGNSAGLSGGGIDLRATSVANLTSSIVAGNTAPVDLDFATDAGSAVNVDMSNIQVSAGILTLNQTGVNLIDVDPMVDMLANNGGFTLPDGTTIETVALKSGSPATNAGSNPTMLANDQRGVGFARNSGGGVDMGAFEIQAAAPPQVTNILVNNGAVQRSLVTSMTVQFDSSTILSAGAFVLSRTANGAAGTIGVVPTPMGNNVVLTFNNTGTIALDPGSSLPDGSYELTIVANNVTGTGGTLDGNKNGISNGSPVDNVTSKLHRLFGDANGDGAITASDFNAFRLEYGVVGPSIFDFDNSGSVTAADFNAFRTRYGLSGYLIP